MTCAMEIKYLAWLSSKGERREVQDGAVFAGLVRDLPENLKHLRDDSEDRQYCVVKNKEVKA